MCIKSVKNIQFNGQISKKYVGENNILVSSFWGYNQSGLYILIAINLIHITFNLQLI